MDINKFKDLLFDKGKEYGFMDMEIYYQSNKKFQVKVFKGEVDSYSIAETGGISFRGVYNGNMGYSYTEKIDEKSVILLLEEAKENSMILESVDHEVIFEGSPLYIKKDLFSEELNLVSAEDKIKLLKEIEKEAFSLDDRVTSINYCFLYTIESEKMIANTKGLLKKDRNNNAGVYISAVVQTGEDIKNGQSLVITRDYTKLNSQEIAKEAVEEALSYLGAEPVESKTYPVILKNNAAASLLQTFSGIFSADNVHKGKSLLKNKLNQTVANTKVTLVDDPFLEDGTACRNFDSEGVASNKLHLIEKGVLKTYLHNLKTAAKDKVASTGHGYKSSYKATISIAPSNLYIRPQEHTFDGMVADIEEGIIITSLQGLHSGANMVSGDFSLAAHGYLIKEGKVVRPVNQITVAGNFLHLLEQIEAVGNDLKFSFPSGSYVGSPSLMIKSLAVAGK